MPRIQIYLPDDLYDAVKTRGLPISEMSQVAVLDALRREALREETDSYLAELAEKLGGPPTQAELTAADRWISRATPAKKRKAAS
jgi:post-segregation antitoxin (ccd killing protein)